MDPDPAHHDLAPPARPDDARHLRDAAFNVLIWLGGPDAVPGAPLVIDPYQAADLIAAHADALGLDPLSTATRDEAVRRRDATVKLMQQLPPDRSAGQDGPSRSK